MTRRKLRLVPGPAGGKCYQCGGISGAHASNCPKGTPTPGRDRDARERKWKRGFLTALEGGELTETGASYVLGWTRGRIEWALNQSAHERTPGLGRNDNGRALAAFVAGLERCSKSDTCSIVPNEWGRCLSCGKPR